MALRVKTFYVDKNQHGVLTEVTTALIQEIGLEGDFLRDIEVVNFGDGILQLSLVYKTSHSSSVLASYPPPGSIIDQDVSIFDHASILFSDSIEAGSIESSSFTLDNISIPPSDVSIENGSNVVQLNLAGKNQDASGHHKIEISSSSLEYQNSDPIQHSAIVAYNVHSQSAPSPGESSPYTSSLGKLGEVEVQGIRVDKSIIPSDRIDLYLQELGITESRLIRFASVDISPSIVYVVFAYFKTLEPHLIQSYPYNYSIFLYDPAVTIELVLIFLEPLDKGYIESTDGLIKIYKTYATPSDITSDKITVDPDGKVIRADITSQITAEGVYDLRIGGLISSDGTPQTRDILYSIQVLGYQAPPPAPPATGGGEINDGSNLGAGVGIFSGKNGDILTFKSISGFGAIDIQGGQLEVSVSGVDWEVTQTVDIHQDNISAVSVTQHEPSINHDNLLNYVVGQHRVISDSSTASTDLWSAQKINSVSGAIQSDIDTHKSDVSNPHIVTVGQIGAVPTSTFDSHTGDTSIHFSDTSVVRSIVITGSSTKGDIEFTGQGVVTVRSTAGGVFISGAPGSAGVLDDLTDVTITAPVDKHFVIYSGLDSQWVNKVPQHSWLGEIGVNSHASIDTHISDSTIHFSTGQIDHGTIVGLGDDDHTQYHTDSRALSWLNAQSIDELSDVDTTTSPPNTDDTLVWDGFNWVPGVVVSSSGYNIGGGAGIFSGMSGSTLTFKSLVGLGDSSISSEINTISISGTDWTVNQPVLIYSGNIDEVNLNHNNLLNYTISQHRSINDAGTASTDLWSAQNISNMSGALQSDIDTRALNSNFTSHTGDSSIHYTVSSINHSAINDDESTKHRLINDSSILATDLRSAQNINNISGSLQSDIDTRTVNSVFQGHSGDTSIHFSTGQIDHGLISNTHNLTTDIDHNQLTNYILGEHRTINDTSVASTDLRSAQNINNISGSLQSDIDTRTVDSIFQGHSGDTSIHFGTGQIDHGLINNTHNLTTDIDHNSLTNTHNLTTSIDHNQLTNYVVDEHRVINDSSVASTDLRSAQNIDSISGSLQSDINTRALNSEFTGHSGDATVHFTESSITHGNLGGLGADDHTQYHNDARATTWLATKSASGLSDISYPTSPSNNKGLIWNAGAWEPTSIDHNVHISNVGVYSHATLDSHKDDTTIHYTEGSIDHTNIQNVGDHTHAQISAHISGLATSHAFSGLSDVSGNVMASVPENAMPLFNGTQWGHDNVSTAAHILLTSNVHGVGVDSFVVGTSGTQTLWNKTLQVPTISDFTNATHTHQNNAGGGTLQASAIQNNQVVKAVTVSGSSNLQDTVDFSGQGKVVVSTDGSKVIISGSAPIVISDLDDVDIVSPADGAVMVYDSTNTAWMNDLNSNGVIFNLDANMSPANGDPLEWNSANSFWTAGFVGASTKVTQITTLPEQEGYFNEVFFTGVNYISCISGSASGTVYFSGDRDIDLNTAVINSTLDVTGDSTFRSNILPAISGGSNIGSPSLRFGSLYFQTGFFGTTSISIDDSINTNNGDITCGTIIASGFDAGGGQPGINQTINILDGDAITTHTLVFTEGILTSYSTI